ncbi:sugar (pentulose or hexulose) kinase [Rhizobium petrolearium]|uniref:FGGY-family carbohydrate kinase n=1 Tax=Neorhizobium petrolearium TaxID=515361 RepID=UPI001AE69B8A|nr:FGGY-family carbohydrate kinase [Neorhizobium petrolearium]MBP1842767.1 sugar (pentulose or hexulose) kinase [Neorhizobium petrolearium]
MNEPGKIAVLDIGKTNAKVVVLDCATGQEIAERRMPNRVLSGPPYPHYDIEALWAFVLEALTAFARQPGFDAISITTHGASAVLLDDMGNLALPALDYEHQYPEETQEAYAALRPAFSETFSPALSGGLNIGAQLHYQKATFPTEFTRVRTILTYPQYWAWRLAGVAANEVTSLGCHTDLWRPREGAYSSLIDALGIRDFMAPVRSAFDALGPVLPEIAERIGLMKPVQVYCGIHDSNASLLPHLIGREPPFAVVSTGTWVVSFAVGGDLDHLDPERDTLANVDAYGRAVPSSRFMGGREFELLTAELGELPLEAALAALPAVIGKGVMLLPNIAAGSGPFPGHERQWINDKGASADERWAAACIYLALMTETCLHLIGAKGPILVEGPFASNAAYLRTLASLLGREVIALPGSTGTSQGAALLAGMPSVEAKKFARFEGSIHHLTDYKENWRRHISFPGRQEPG